MKGLLKKDLIYLREQFALIMVMVIVVAGGLVAISSSNSSFSMGFINGYIAVVAAVLTTSTISYDQSDNGMLYLMTLPINRKMYVNSKYMETLIIAFVTGVVLMAINLSSGKMIGEPVTLSDIMLIFSVAVSSILFINSISITAYLKFEGRKGSVAMIVAVCIIGIAGYSLVKILEKLGYDIMYIINSMDSVGAGALAGLLIVVSLICLAISYAISTKIMVHKEF